MQYGLPFQTVFQSTDPRLRAKLAKGTLYVLASIVLSPVLVGIAGFFILGGYGLRLLQNVQTHQEHPLPEWDQWRQDLRSGFFLFVAGIVWFLPLILLSIWVSWSSNQDPVASGLISLLTTVVGWIIGPGIAIALAQGLELSDAFRFRTILAWVGQNWLQCLLASLIAGLISIPILVAAAIAGTLALGIGLLVTIPFAFLMAGIYQNHLFGQLARTRDLTVMFPEEA